MSSEFVHLHVHTQYSLLDGFSKIPKLMERAKELNMPAVGITDHGTMFGVIDFFKEAQKAEIKPIIGVETYMAARGMQDRDSQLDRSSFHLLLLAENMTGYKNLLKIASASQLEGFYYNPRIDHDFLAAHSEGLICTTGCMSGEVPRAFLRENPAEARRKMDWYWEVFGPDNFFVELQDHDIPEIPGLNKQLIELGNHYGAKFVATNDVHYVTPEEAPYQDIMLCVQTGSLLNDPKRMRMSSETFYLRSAEEMTRLFAGVPGALENTLLIADRCNVDLSTDGYILPEFEVPEGHTDKSYLRELCEEGLVRRYGDHVSDPEIQERLEYELGIIDEMGFNAYFLIVWDLCQFAQREGIWYNARGSAAGSIVAYSLDITLVDPLEHGLIFERFLNPGRVSMPDIDLDFQDDLRYRMLEYCTQKYGEDKVAAIITFGKLKARAAVRDVGRVLDIPLSEVDKIAKMIPTMPLDITIEKALEEVPDLQQEYQTRPYVRDLLDNAREVEGSLRNAGTHAAGVVITDNPVVEYIPLHRPTGASAGETPIKTVTQFEMSTVDELGLLKVDFLGLASLTIMERCCRMIKERHGVEYNLYNIPLDDEETYNQLGLGNTAGVFQLEGSGMTRWVVEMKPHNLSNVIAMVALYRPGPMQFIPDYIKRMHGEEEIEYRHELLEPILKETYGITVYQEQIMYTAMGLGGYNASEADFLRKAVAKKKEESLLDNKEKFIAGAEQNGVPRRVSEQIFADWEAFARYGFPKGHAADYAVIAVETAYLKTHYPVEYMTALLSVYQSNSDKVAFYAADCRNLGIDVLAPDINKSKWDFTIEDGEDGKSCIRFGMGAIKNVGHGPVDIIMEGRGEGLFEDMTDLANRIDLRKVGKRALESLIKAGALDSFGPRMALMQVFDRAVSISASTFQAAEAGQMTFFGNDSGLVEKIQLPEVDAEYNRREQLNWERELIGLYLSDHPLSPVMETLENVITHYSSQLGQAEPQQFVRVAGLVTRLRPHITKKGGQMAFVGLEDTQGVIDLVIFPRTWKEVQDIVVYDKVVIVEGKIDAQAGEPKILVDKVTDEIKWVRPVGEAGSKPNGGPPKGANGSQKPGANGPRQQRPEPKPTPPPEPKPAPKKKVSEPTPTYTSNGDVPPPPEAFPPNWESEWETGMPGAVVSQPEPVAEAISETPAAKQEAREPAGQEPAAPEPVAQKPEPVEEVEAQVEGEQPEAVESEDEQAENKPEVVEEAPPEPPPVQAPKPAPPPVALSSPTQNEPQHAPQMLTVVLRSCDDRARDILRVRRIHGTMISYPGEDRFAFYVIERSRGYRLEFPNDTINASGELIAKLEGMVGKENVIIEPYRYSGD